jgi:hypothetical protein
MPEFLVGAAAEGRESALCCKGAKGAAGQEGSCQDEARFRAQHAELSEQERDQSERDDRSTRAEGSGNPSSCKLRTPSERHTSTLRPRA